MKRILTYIIVLIFAASCGNISSTTDIDSISLPENDLMIGESTIKGKINGYFPKLGSGNQVRVTIDNPITMLQERHDAQPNGNGEFEIRIPLTQKHQTIRISYLSMGSKMVASIDSTEIVEFNVWKTSLMGRPKGIKFYGANATLNNGIIPISPLTQPGILITPDMNNIEYEAYKNLICSTYQQEKAMFEKADIPAIAREWALINTEMKVMTYYINAGFILTQNNRDHNVETEIMAQAVKDIEALSDLGNKCLYYNNLHYLGLQLKLSNNKMLKDIAENDSLYISSKTHELLHDTIIDALNRMDNPFFGEYAKWHNQNIINKIAAQKARGSYASHQPGDKDCDSILVEIMKPYIGKPTIIYMLDSYEIKNMLAIDRYDSVNVAEKESEYVEKGVNFVYLTKNPVENQYIDEMKSRLKGSVSILDAKDFETLLEKTGRDYNSHLMLNSKGELVHKKYKDYEFMSQPMQDNIDLLIKEE